MGRSCVGLLACASLLVACGASTPPIELSGEWPSDPGSLEDATRAWTRSGRQIAGLDEDLELIIKVKATYRSPSWRAAYIAHMKDRGELNADELKTLGETQRETAGKYHEFVLLVTTHDRRINDLARGTRSMWKVKLRNASGAEVAPIEIKKDRRPPAEIAVELPHMERYDEIYIARFPADHPILGADAERFSIRLWSARASLALDWAP